MFVQWSGGVFTGNLTVVASFVVWDAGARLKSPQEGQGFEVIPMKLEKACPEVAGIHPGYRVLIVFLK